MRNQMKKALLVGFGLLCVALGVIGAFLPVMPTVPFLLLALWAFARSSDRLHAWLLNHPRFGPPLRNWQEHGAIPARAKLLSVGSMGVAAVWLAFFSGVPAWAMALALAIMAYGAWFVLSRPTLR